ncbi:glycosyltransferase [Flavobacterium pectinovorum]|uniref:glycosyltransferase n=1 Tax=Flavobacterium pectinovorum TaxID=29533 RepID=UPI00265DBDC1|nr:glycosyltransferase [Flavobacterium pectinovorum]WKL45953.1 glycosyltransferase [Flavobacterium pectinovorum]
MRIVQIIDSLEAGGAERMAVNYANALANEVSFSGLISTRKEGILKNQIDLKVSYLFLNKKKTIDFKSVFRLRSYLIEKQIDIVHAHSSSFFIAVLVKLVLPKIKIIWHDHYGISSDLQARKNLGLKFGSLFFKGSIAVNSALKNWAESYLNCQNIIYFPNFIDDSISLDAKLTLHGIEGKRIVCVANLRPQKNHTLLIEAANIIKQKYPDWTFHLFGKDFEDDYSLEIKNKIKNLKLERTVFFYGTTDNVASVLKQCDIGVLCSFSEGLPLAILEYGLHKLPVVATNVGEISKVIISEKEGLIVESNNLDTFTNSILTLIENKNKRIEMSSRFNDFILLNYGQKAIIKDYVLWLDSLINFTRQNNLKI